MGFVFKSTDTPTRSTILMKGIPLFIPILLAVKGYFPLDRA